MALERFIPKSPDIFIRNSQDFEVAKFGHLNTIVEYINNNSAKPAGLNGYVQFNNNSALGGDAGLFWDNTNKRLGIGTVIPATTFQVNGVQALTNADLTGYPLYSIFNIVRNGATSIALDRFTGAPHFNLRAAGGTIASPTTQVGELGNIGWWSYSGTAFNRNVLLLAEASNFVGGLAQTRRLSIGMGESGPNSDYYFSIVNGNTFFGSGASSVTPTARVQIKGSGSTSATTSLLVQNSAGIQGLAVSDDGTAYAGWDTTGGANSYFSANGDVSLGRYGLGLTYIKSTGAVKLQSNNFEFAFGSLYMSNSSLLSTGSAGFGVSPSLARLQVRGSGSTGSTSSLLVQNSAGVTALEIFDSLTVRSDNSNLFFSNTTAQHRLGLMTFTNNSISCLSVLNIGGNTATTFTNATLSFQTSTTFNALGAPNNATRSGISIVGDFTNPGAGIISVGNNFNITTALNTSVGTVTLNQFNITNAVNTTGGITLQRGFYYNPTLTGTVGFTHNAIETVTGNVLLATTSGNVGIGTSSPTKKLDVVGAAADGVIRVAGPYSEIQLRNKNSAYNVGDWKPEIYFLENGVFQSSISYSGSYFEFGAGITAGAIFGSALTSNNGTLDLYGAAQTITFTDTAFGLIRGAISMPNVGTPSGYGMNISVNSGDMSLITGAGSTRLTIKQAGNVGIGATGPTARLQVQGSGTTSGTTAFLVTNGAATPANLFSVTDNGAIVCGIGGQGSVQLGTLNLVYPNTITYSSSYNFIIGGTTAGSGTISVDGSSIRFLAANNGISYTQPTAKSFLIQKEQGGSDATSFLNISGADMTNTAYAAKGGPVRIYGGLNNGIAEQGLVVLAHNGTTTQGAVVVGGTSANASALIDIQSTTKGFLPPRMTTAERVAISSPANGLIVFDTDVQNLCYRRDGVWVQATFAAV